MAAFNESFVYRITGPQSIERLDPLVREFDLNLVNADSDNGLTRFNFVWETTCEKHMRDKHRESCILNKLNNTQIIESKSSFSFLQLNMDRKFLDCFVASNAAEVRAWATKHWANELSNDDTVPECDWWAVKASNGNGGKDIWIVNKDTSEESLKTLPAGDEYVIQRYVHRPLLYKGKKFHFRCYSILNADMSALVYQKAFILTAGLDFSYEDTDLKRHVTNLSVNKHFANHPGQVPCNLVESYPQVYEQIKDIWRSVVTAAAPFMQYQTSLNHFEFFGMDIIADEAGNCWLIEANRLPGLESSNNNKEEEDVFYNEMMRAVLRIVLRPLLLESPTAGSVNSNTERAALSVSELNSRFVSILGGWDYVKSASDTASNDCQAKAETFKNLFRWKAFTKKTRGQVMVEAMK